MPTKPPLISRVVTVTISARYGERVGIRAFSDLHIDERLVRWTDIKDIAAADAERGIKYAVGIGDIANLVLPPDKRRWRPSVQPKELAGRDDWLDATVAFVAERLQELGYQWLLLTPGNHEEAVRRHHGVDVTRALASAVGCPAGPFSGALDIRVELPHNSGSSIRIIYHHGAWGGELAKGYHGAFRWFHQHDAWDFGLYGHCHGSRHDAEERVRVQGDRVVRYRAHLINLSSAVDSYSDDASVVHYAELRGYRRAPFAPAILWTWWQRHRTPRHLRKYTSVEV